MIPNTKYRVVVYPKDIMIGGTQDQYREICEEIADEIKEHIRGWSMVAVEEVDEDD